MSFLLLTSSISFLETVPFLAWTNLPSEGGGALIGPKHVVNHVHNFLSSRGSQPTTS